MATLKGQNMLPIGSISFPLIEGCFKTRFPDVETYMYFTDQKFIDRYT